MCKSAMHFARHSALTASFTIAWLRDWSASSIMKSRHYTLESSLLPGADMASRKSGVPGNEIAVTRHDL